MRWFLLLLPMLVSVQAHAASLRPMTTLHGPVVLLRDLFDDAGRNADRVLGPGPDPGGRIVVPAAQLDAIARQFSVAWHSASGADRAVLEWPGRLLSKDDALHAARLALRSAGAPDDADIELPGFNPPTVPADAKPTAVASQVEYDSNTGRFTALLTVSADGMHPIDTRIAGRVVEMVAVPVAISRLLPDALLQPADLRMARVRATTLTSDVVRSPDQVLGMELRRPIPAGQPLPISDLVRPPLVRRGSTVQVELVMGALSVSGQATAMETGAEGQRIRVQNTTSRALIMSEVIGPNRVRIMPDASPIADQP